MSTRQETDDSLPTIRSDVATMQALFLADNDKYCSDMTTYEADGITINETYQPRNGNPTRVGYFLVCLATEDSKEYKRKITEEPTLDDTGWVEQVT